MAKKVAKTQPSDATTSTDTLLKLTSELKAQAKDIQKLNKRIDNIVNAHESCKTLKGF